MQIFRERRISKISKFIDISKAKIKVITHEDCHKFYSYYFFGHKKKSICITAEGIGDNSNGSVSVVTNDNKRSLLFIKGKVNR